MKLHKSLLVACALLALLVLNSCDTDKKKENAAEPDEEERVVSVPVFNSDSAYFFVQKQVNFGPRVPNTEAHQQTGDYLIDKFKSYGAFVQTQEFESQTFDNKTIQLRNIIASYSPEKTKRILLAAHWDSRPFADKDDERTDEAIDAANDGASGVAVLLEIARLLNNNVMPNVGVDMILFDGEDWGNDVDYQGNYPTPPGLDSWWCLGSQHWSKNKHRPNYSAYYGILLDMVGGKDAKFYIEGYSKQFAPSIVDKVWNRGVQLGHSRYFVRQNGGHITDDHYFVNQYAKIPMIDIIPTDPVTQSFGSFHHTHDDNMDIISRETLTAVGSTVMHVIYYE
ncbi:MAG: M28 family peptidase [Bacteroidota bacterium]